MAPEQPPAKRKRKSRAKPPGERKPTGRPRTALSPQFFEDELAAGATMEEIADLLGIDRSNLYRRTESDPVFRDAFRKGRSRLSSSLRRAQVAQAMTGNPTMLIWLGKTLLGQREARAEDEPIVDAPPPPPVHGWEPKEKPNADGETD